MPKGALAAFVDLAPKVDSFRDSILGGLTARSKSIACRFLYDSRGSALFEEICALPEYYLTRTELAILRAHVGEIAALAGERVALIEYGSGAGVKIRLLLDALVDPVAYVPIDISREQLTRVAGELAVEYPHIAVRPLCADYTTRLTLPPLSAE